ncbi:non-hydrolyzing UDP-N-acetylglucosamine 2-epimerase [Rhodothermus profundi]|uniref:UDP-N-acetylglucosamine 2-epimerase (non-hydrolyzing) n=1 Tax=Rhodothermus profundi TaxID=633813 RepID=A0A1M6PK54_9BACT|nr:UDP-N-acetylglucosamine 2-epimerase (non-hydrolyzing) [Rhodothermus profundi]SHK08273.1 UDP-N-acetylglucosamine 2-epimerase (non-hydrolysing) [Rhodothermus profundi]
MKAVYTVFCVVGTRPEAIKMAPVIQALQESGCFKPVVCSTGQHREMLYSTLEMFDIVPDIDLQVMLPNQRLSDLTARILTRIDDAMGSVNPDYVLVQGDTTSTMAAAIAAFYRKIPVGHIEAGLRTRNLHAPFPEEANRRIVSVVADYHFAPTQAARINLLSEGVTDDRIFVTGNTVVDALLWMAERIKKDSVLARQMEAAIPALKRCREEGRKLILVTGHRRENFGEGFANICKAISQIAERKDVEIVYPVHLNPNVRGPVYQMLGNYPNISLIDPVDYRWFVGLMLRSYLILTDSGGVQEEAPVLGKPVLVMRQVTEREEAVKEGVVKLVGTDVRRIVTETTRLLDDKAFYAQMSRSVLCYGDGYAAQRIVGILSSVNDK